MKRGIFLVVLSAQEITFFQQFQKKLCSINLTFQKTGNKKPLNLFLRGTIERIGPVKGKQNVCMMDASLKACPNDLVEIIGDYITAFDGLKNQYENFSGKAIPVDEHVGQAHAVQQLRGARAAAPPRRGRRLADALGELPLPAAVRRAARASRRGSPARRSCTSRSTSSPPTAR